MLFNVCLCQALNILKNILKALPNRTLDKYRCLNYYKIRIEKNIEN